MPKRIAYIFSGQGAQKPGMMRSLFDGMKGPRAAFETVSQATGRDMEALCFSAAQEELNQTINAQLAMLTADLAAYGALEELGVRADFCAGFSLGEYAALVACGALELGQAARLVQRRAEAMSAHQAGGMAAVIGLPPEQVEALCSRVTEAYVIPANYNSPVQTVVSGDANGLAALKPLVAEAKGRFMPLKVSGAFHSALMAPAARDFAPTLAATDFAEARIPIVCNVTGQPFDPASENWQTLMEQQMTSPVRWRQSIEKLLDMGAEVFIECGPGKVLAGLNKRICPDVKTFALEDMEALEAIRAYLA